ncbi:hypothetical protein K9K77_02390 [Candidatus Babeliales bacterium]|nr:hypothetical protein [Candidatus Babeliales bacterium]
MMGLAEFCSMVGTPVLALTGVGVGLAALGVDLLKTLQLGGLREVLQYVVGAVGLLCLVHWAMMTFNMM